jgi:hypothetical protein
MATTAGECIIDCPSLYASGKAEPKRPFVAFASLRRIHRVAEGEPVPAGCAPWRTEGCAPKSGAHDVHRAAGQAR